MRKKIGKINIFLQARLNSDRLPYKSLIKLNQIPLVVLCAKRLCGENVDKFYLREKGIKNDFNFFIIFIW